MRPSMRAFLFAALSIAALAPITYLGFTQVAHWRDVQRSDADNDLRFGAEGLARTLGQALAENVREITALANTVALQGMTDAGALQSLLHQHNVVYPAWLGVNISGLDSRAFVSEPTGRAMTTMGDREYYQTMLWTGRTSVSGVEVGRMTHVPTIHVCAPIFVPPAAPHPTFSGAVVGALSLGYMQELTVRAVEVFGDMRAQVLDGRVRVVLDSTPVGVPPLADLSANPMYAAIAPGAATLRDGYNEQRQPVRVALARVPEPGIDWVVAVMLPTKTIEEQASRARVGTLVAIVAALLLGFVFAYILSSWLARPISRLAEYATRVAKGEPVPMPAPARLDVREVTELTETVFSMVSQLQSQADALREREDEQIMLARARQELDIAERIQTGVLPRNLALPGFESAALMRPAEAVGGDYYEILPSASGLWIAAGDVSGHGLHAGLVMLMLQSALAALAFHAPDARPSEIVQAVNRVLVENIRRRLGRDDHVTLVLAHIALDGSFAFAGGHEPLLVLRATGDKCEIVDTPGPWVGIVPDIDRHLHDGSGRLEPGDLLVFHSDGIVEAGDRHNTPFGLERLCAAVERLRAQPAERMCSEIVREAEEWSQKWSSTRRDDDMTVVVVRRA
jgi:serine phosphatase RsbU (regulator of sigma subunit)